MLRDELQERAKDLYSLKSETTHTELHAVKSRLSLALKLISKMKNHQIS